MSDTKLPQPRQQEGREFEPSQHVKSPIQQIRGLKIGDPSSVELLLAMLADEDEEARSEAVSALGEAGDVRSVEPLLAVLQDKSEGSWVRSYAAAALGDPRAVEPLIQALLHDRHGSVRSNAARALGLLGDGRAVDSLVQSIAPDLGSIEDYDEDDTTKLEIVWYSAWSLVQLRDPGAIQPLIQLMLESPSGSIPRMLAIETLGELGDERALAAFDLVQEDERPADETMAASFDRYIAEARERIIQRQSNSGKS